MSFSEMPAKRKFAKDRVYNRVAVHTYGTNGGIGFALSGDVLEKIGRPPFVKVLVGTGDHRGMLLIRPAHAKTDNTYKLTGRATKNSHQQSFTVGRHRIGAAKVDLKVTPCDFDITEEGVAVRLPAVMVAPDPTAAKFELLKKGA